MPAKDQIDWEPIGAPRLEAPKVDSHQRQTARHHWVPRNLNEMDADLIGIEPPGFPEGRLISWPRNYPTEEPSQDNII